MSRKYKFWDSNQMYFISFATVNWIDIFTRNEYRNILLDSWKYCQQAKGLEIFGWCIMPSHVHMIVSSHGNKSEDIVWDMESFTSTQLRAAMESHPQESRKEWMVWMMKRAGKKNVSNRDWQFWQHNNKPLEINGHDMCVEMLHYIHTNPVVAGFVHEPENCIFSSALGYEKNNGFIVLAALD